MLVNNAGMSPLYDRIENVTEDLWDKVLDVNLKGPFRLTALVGVADGRGRGRLDHHGVEHRGGAPDRAA